jgi:hypothetical protein
MTIRLRLALAYGAAILITVAVVGLLVWWQLAVDLRASLDQTLATRASDALTALENNGQAGLQESDAGDPVRAFVALFDGQGKLTDATADAPAGIALPPAGQPSAELRLAGTTYAIHVVRSEDGRAVGADRPDAGPTGPDAAGSWQRGRAGIGRRGLVARRTSPPPGGRAHQRSRPDRGDRPGPPPHLSGSAR